MRASTLIRFLLLPLLLASILSATSGPAQAENADKHARLQEGYSMSGWLRSYRPNVCFRYTVSGIKDYTARYKAVDPAG